MNRFKTTLFTIALGGLLLTGCEQTSKKPATAAPAPTSKTAPAATPSETAPAGGAAAETPATGEQQKPAGKSGTTAPAPK